LFLAVQVLELQTNRPYWILLQTGTLSSMMEELVAKIVILLLFDAY